MSMATDFDIGEFRSCTCLRLRRVAREATRIYDGFLEPTGLGANQLIMLVALYHAGQAGRGVTAAALAERIGTDPTTLSRNLKPLARRALIATRPDAADGRARLLHVTARGEAKLREAAPLWRKAEVRMKKALGAAQIKTLHELLERSAGGLHD